MALRDFMNLEGPQAPRPGLSAADNRLAELQRRADAYGWRDPDNLDKAPGIFDPSRAMEFGVGPRPSTRVDWGRTFDRGIFDGYQLGEDRKSIAVDPETFEPIPEEGYGSVTLPSGERFGAEGLGVASGTPQDIFRAPGGGKYTTPEDTLPYTPEERQQATDLGFETVGEYKRAQDQARRTQRSKERIAIRSMSESMREQGMSPQEIADSIGWTPQMSTTETYRRMVALNNRRTQEGEDTPQNRRQQRENDRIANEARWDTDEEGNRIPKNQAARFQEMDRIANQKVDPEGETLYESLTPGQKREYNRLRRKVANGVAMSRDEKRMKGIIDSALERAQGEYEGRLLAAAIDEKRAAAETREAREELNRLTSELSAVDAALEGEIDEDRRDELESERQKIVSSILGEPTTGDAGDAAGGDEGQPAAELSAEDQRALDWANQNPDDPRAVQIKARLGVQ